MRKYLVSLTRTWSFILLDGMHF